MTRYEITSDRIVFGHKRQRGEIVDESEIPETTNIGILIASGHIREVPTTAKSGTKTASTTTPNTESETN